MKKPQIDLAQLKAGVSAKLKRKRGSLSPASTSSSKKNAAEKDPSGEQSSSSPAPLEIENIPVILTDPSIPKTSRALEEIEKITGIEGAKSSTSIILPLPSTIISLLRKGEEIDWETAIEAEDFVPVRETLYNLAIKVAKESVQSEYLDLKLNFLVVDDDEEVGDIQSGTMNLGAEGQNFCSHHG